MVNCPYCGARLEAGQSIIACPQCGTFHHPDCWQENGLHCSTLGCPGAGSLPVQVFDPPPDREPPQWLGELLQKLKPAPTWSGHLRVAQGALTGAVGWGLCGWATVSLVSLALLPVKSDISRWYDLIGALVVLGLAVYGAIRGIHARAREIDRTLCCIAGGTIFLGIGQLLILVLSLESLGKQIEVLSQMPIVWVAGRCGLLCGALFPPILRGGLGALLGLYLAAVVSYVQPEPGILREEFSLGLLAIVAGMTVFPLLSAKPVRAMVRAMTAALPGLIIMFAFRSASSSGNWLLFLKLSLLSVLSALPLAGVAHSRGSWASTATISIPSSSLSPAQVSRLMRAGAMGSAFVFLVVGLTTFLGSMLTPLIIEIVAVVLDLSITEHLLSSLGVSTVRIPVYGVWVMTLTAYASLWGAGRLTQSGPLYNLYRLARFVVLLSMCCLASLLVERALEAVLTTQSGLRLVGRHLLLMGYGLPAGVTFLAVIFTLAYTKDRMPVSLIGLGFVLWLLQVVALSAVLSFVGGVVGLWVGILFGPLLEGQASPQFLNLSWREVFPFGGSYLGLFSGLCIMLFRWLKGDLGIVVSSYRRFLQDCCYRVDNWIDRLVQWRGPWWATAGFGAASIGATWLFVQVLSPALVRRF